MGNTNKPWEIVFFSDSNYMGDLLRRRSISSFILCVIGVLVSRQSKSQKSVSLSRSEAEYIAFSEAVKEVVFVIQLLGSMKILVKYPVTIRVDNKGVIFMANNIATIHYTKHMDIRYKYINDYVYDGVLKKFFVKSADNDSNILTKNLSLEVHERHSNKIVGEMH